MLSIKIDCLISLRIGEAGIVLIASSLVDVCISVGEFLHQQVFLLFFQLDCQQKELVLSKLSACVLHFLDSDIQISGA